MKKLYNLLVVAILASLVLTACGAGGAAKANNLLKLRASVVSQHCRQTPLRYQVPI